MIFFNTKNYFSKIWNSIKCKKMKLRTMTNKCTFDSEIDFAKKIGFTAYGLHRDQPLA